MRIVYFAHSLLSCWNNGNAHFLRGTLRALAAAGHEIVACEPRDAWSVANLVADHGEAALDGFTRAYPTLTLDRYDPARLEATLDAALDGADLVIVHEWNEPGLVAAVGARRAQGAGFALLFHDTHHRAVSDPDAIARLPLDAYDGVLAFGATLADIYRRAGWGGRAHVWHEAADTALFHPPEVELERRGMVWIGNWGDGERSDELEAMLLRPAQEAGIPLEIYGVRYPDAALAMLARHGATYRSWLANAAAPAVYARHAVTAHVPRRFYASLLPGIPTIRVFEALACGIPLVSAPWEDSENLFSPGEDFLVARDGAEMTRHLRALANEPALRASLVARGLAAVRDRHSCAHRAGELLGIARTIAAAPAPAPEQRA